MLTARAADAPTPLNTLPTINKLCVRAKPHTIFQRKNHVDAICSMTTRPYNSDKGAQRNGPHAYDKT